MLLIDRIIPLRSLRIASQASRHRTNYKSLCRPPSTQGVPFRSGRELITNAAPAAYKQIDYKMRDIIAVIGTTGVGKSDLAVSLAQRLSSRSRACSAVDDANHGAQGQVEAGPSRYDGALVLSADSMQLYQGLDVITNKMTLEEMGGVNHWGLDMVKPGEPSWELGRWCTEADKQVCKRGNL